MGNHTSQHTNSTTSSPAPLDLAKLSRLGRLASGAVAEPHNEVVQQHLASGAVAAPTMTHPSSHMKGGKGKKRRHSKRGDCNENY